jgi:RHS repeat-associated protein
MVDHINYPNGQVVQYTYYTSGPSNERLQTITNEGPSTDGTLSQFSYGYDAAGDITSWTQQTDSNAPVTYSYGYDGARELLSAIETSSTASGALDTYAYRYDSSGNRLGQQINDTLANSAYNNLNQVTSVSGTGALQLLLSGSLSEPGTVTVAGNTVATDTNNNFTILAPVVTGSNAIPIAAASTGTSNSITNKTIGVNVTGGTPIPSLQYDLSGNLTVDGTMQSYVYDAANRLVKIWYGTVGSSPSTTMSYDGLGRRIQILETSSSGTVTSTKNLLYDGMTLREERNAGNAVTKMYFANGVQISGSNYYYTRDHLGSIREMTTGTNAAIVARYDYDPYGQQTLVSGTAIADFGFTGLYVHQPSELDFASYRPYLPPLGRWISRDPIEQVTGDFDSFAELLPDGPNLYAYVANNPIEHVDWLGLTLWKCITRSNEPPWGWFKTNHAYIYDDHSQRCCGRFGSGGIGSTSNCHTPKPGDFCVPIAGSSGKENSVFDCCKDPHQMDAGLFTPGLNDCHTSVDHCLAQAGLSAPKLPRTGGSQCSCPAH